LSSSFKNKPFISLITVCFNSESTIKDTLDSVSIQSYDNYEYIIIDGCSTDSTLDVVSEYASIVDIQISESDLGIYYAMNKGIEIASGKFVGFLNSDDFFPNNDSLSIIANSLEMECCDGVYGDISFVARENKTSVIRNWRSGKFAPWKVRFGWIPPHPSLFVSKVLLLKAKKFDTSINIASDYDLIFRLIFNHNVQFQYIPNVLVHMRVGGESNSSLFTMMSQNLEIFRIFRKKYNLFILCIYIFSKIIIRIIQYIDGFLSNFNKKL